MANSDATHLEALRTARDAITAAIAEGQLTVSYAIGRRTVTVEANTEALERLEGLIDSAESKASRAAGGAMRLARLRRAC